MYKNCMFCNGSLGANEVIEPFPVGRRLAFDAGRGRLWVVCRRCERWNLTPLEERWEAVETCERLFRDTRVRISTEHVGLARLGGGVELVRIGEPLRPEFAAWRYGDQFGRRRKRAIVYGAGAAVAFGGLVAGGAVFGVVGGGLLAQSGNFWNLWMNGRTLVKLRPEDGRVIPLKRMDLHGTRIRASDDGVGFRIEIRAKNRKEWFAGDEARRIAAQVVPAINRGGAKRDIVAHAVQEIERHGHPELFLADVVKRDRFSDGKGVPGYLDKMPRSTKLALEMALHEEDERRALEGELWRLERAWAEAEEIAEIADSLLLPEGTEAFLEEHRRGSPGSVAGSRGEASRLKSAGDGRGSGGEGTS